MTTNNKEDDSQVWVGVIPEDLIGVVNPEKLLSLIDKFDAEEMPILQTRPLRVPWNKHQSVRRQVSEAYEKAMGIGGTNILQKAYFGLVRGDVGALAKRSLLLLLRRK